MEILIGIVLVVAGAIYWAVQQSKKAEERRSEYSAALRNARSLLLSDENSASLPVLSAASIGYRAVGRENLIAVHDGISRLEYKSTGRYRTHGASFSVPIMKGVRYRVGSTSVRTQKEWQVIASGRLIVTDKAVAFESPERNERITWTQIAGVELHIDGFTIAKRSGPPRRFIAANPDPHFAVVLELLAARVD